MPDTLRPNILWISFEDTSPRFGCYGDAVAGEHRLTPRVDRLAEEGCRYDRAFVTAPVCAPSRLSIITGMYPTAVGGQHMRTTHQNRHTPEMPTPYEVVLPHHAKLIPEYLRAAGYYCSNNVKTDYQFTPPPSAWHDCSRGGHWRNRPDESQPFFAVFNNAGGDGPSTHESGMWPETFEAMHGRREPRTDPAAVEVPPYLPDTPAVREAIARQYDNIALSDAWLGGLLDELEADGLAENTIVILWSDHGEGLPRCKRWPHDSGTRVPLIVRWPERIVGGPGEGTASDALVSLIDLGPTVLEACGVARPTHLHGVSLIRPDIESREYVFATRDRYDEAYDMVRSVRDKRYRLVQHLRPDLPRLGWLSYRDRHPAMRELWRLHAADALTGDPNFLFTPRPIEELYDTHNDPHEVHNLADDPEHEETLRRLRGVLADWRARYDVYGGVDEAEMVRRWWPGGVQPTTASVRFIGHDVSSFAPDAAPPAAYPGLPPLGESATLTAPAVIQLHCPTQGASILWTDQPGDDATWRLYTSDLRLSEPSRVTLRARACRVGFADSQETTLELEVRAESG